MTARVEITDEQRARILALYREGQSIKQIRGAVDLSHRQVSEVVHEAGLMRGRGGRHTVPLTDELRARALRLYQSGQSVRQVHPQLGVSYGTLYRMLHDAGVLRPNHVRKLVGDRLDLALRLYADHTVPIAEVCRRVGVAQLALMNALDEAGATRRRPRRRTRSEISGKDTPS